MPETLLTIQEAAEISGKSIQTIRRALKGSKLEAKKRKTPQGFNYLISQESLFDFYKLNTANMSREQGSVKPQPENNSTTASSTNVSAEFATISDLKKFEKDMRDMMGENKQDKENFMRFMKAFQDRFVVLENQFKLLEEPSKKRWFHFWK